MKARKYIVEFYNGDLDQVIGIYDTTHAAMGAILYHVLTTYGDGVPEFGVKSTGDSGYDCYYDVTVSYTKKPDGGYEFDKGHVDRYRVFYLTDNFEED